MDLGKTSSYFCIVINVYSHCLRPRWAGIEFRYGRDFTLLSRPAVRPPKPSYIGDGVIAGGGVAGALH